MEPTLIQIIYYPTTRGYSGYARELEGLSAEGATLEELVANIKHMLDLRVETLREIGHTTEAEELKRCRLEFLED